MAIAVPTRIQKSRITEPPEETLLQGWRIAVKDNFQIKNIRRSACNWAYYELCPPANETAPSIQKLCDAGATVVGTTKLACFAATEEPADGYQSPAGSSSGSGVAVAAYEWLDITIGSDSKYTHSLTCRYLLLQRVEGTAALRIGMAALECVRLTAICRVESYSISSLDLMYRLSLVGSLGSVGLSRRFGMVKIYRSSSQFTRYAACITVLPCANHNIDQRPLSIIYASDYMDKISNPQQMSLIDIFTADLEATFEVKHQKISFEKAWQANPPRHANGASLPEYIKDASRDSFF